MGTLNTDLLDDNVLTCLVWLGHICHFESTLSRVVSIIVPFCKREMNLLAHIEGPQERSLIECRVIFKVPYK